jgi:hypothetical protein
MDYAVPMVGKGMKVNLWIKIVWNSRVSYSAVDKCTAVGMKYCWKVLRALQKSFNNFFNLGKNFNLDFFLTKKFFQSEFKKQPSSKSLDGKFKH